MPSAAIATWDLLKKLGFIEDDEVISDEKPGLSYSFGKFKFSAGHMLNFHFQKVVVLGGILSYRNSFAMIHNEMAIGLESPEQGMAWLSWTLDQATGDQFHPPNEPTWLGIGREHQHLLPWIRHRAEMLANYEARPRCTVSREWLRLALKELARPLGTITDDVPVSFSFDGSVLRILCAGKVVPIPAEGRHWTQEFSIPAAKLRRLPKRLTREIIEISYLDSAIRIANWCYGGAVAVDVA